MFIGCSATVAAERFHIFTFRDNSVTSLEIKWTKKAEVETKNKSCTNNYISSWGQKEKWIRSCIVIIYASVFLLFVRLVVGARVNSNLLSFLNWLRHKYLPYLKFLLVSVVVDECSKPLWTNNKPLASKKHHTVILVVIHSYRIPRSTYRFKMNCCAGWSKIALRFSS